MDTGSNVIGTDFESNFSGAQAFPAAFSCNFSRCSLAALISAGDNFFSGDLGRSGWGGVCT